MASVAANQTLLRAKELAAHLRVSRATVNRWVHEKRIPAIRLTPRTLRFDPVAVAEALGLQQK